MGVCCGGSQRAEDSKQAFFGKLITTLLTYAQTGTVQKMDWRARPPDIKIMPFVTEVDRLLTSPGYNRRRALRHFAILTATCNAKHKKSPHLARKHVGQLEVQLLQHQHWMFDFASDCL